MKLKTVEVNGKTYAELNEGKPVYIQGDGKETAIDGVMTMATISRLNSEAKANREAKEAALAKLEAFAGIDDPAEAVKALRTVKNLDDKKLIDAGEAEKVKQDAVKATEEKYKPIVAERDRLNKAFVEEKIGGGFARSKFIADKVAAPIEMMQATFGSKFKIENGEVIGYHDSGEKIFSRQTERAGKFADFDEALEIMVESAPYREAILKGTTGKGSGAQGGAKGGSVKNVTRAQFDAMAATARSAFALGGGVIAD